MTMDKLFWYKADFETEINGETFQPDSEYFVAENDEIAVEYAKMVARQGWDYADVDGHVNGELVSVELVDEENDYVAIKTIWF